MLPGPNSVSKNIHFLNNMNFKKVFFAISEPGLTLKAQPSPTGNYGGQSRFSANPNCSHFELDPPQGSAGTLRYPFSPISPSSTRSGVLFPGLCFRVECGSSDRMEYLFRGPGDLGRSVREDQMPLSEANFAGHRTSTGKDSFINWHPFASEMLPEKLGHHIEQKGLRPLQRVEL